MGRSNLDHCEVQEGYKLDGRIEQVVFPVVFGIVNSVLLSILCDILY